ncbi:hypothetical protein [Thiomicrospira sp.]|uniref:hypothetical protein n=1 Tax=Thiomicrospira sp. TaxID=935 RepID=UPI002F9323D5
MHDIYRCRQLLDTAISDKKFTSVWVDLSGSKLDVLAQRASTDEYNKGAGIGASITNKTHIGISYLYGFEGIGTFIMNTWINLARQMVGDPSSVTVSGFITETIEPARTRVVDFYKKFGFQVSKKIGRDSDIYFSANLADLLIIPHRSDPSIDFLLMPSMFFNQEGESLSSRIESLPPQPTPKRRVSSQT